MWSQTDQIFDLIVRNPKFLQMIPNVFQTTDFFDLISSQRKYLQMSQPLDRNHFIDKVSRKAQMDTVLELGQSLCIQFVDWRQLKIQLNMLLLLYRLLALLFISLERFSKTLFHYKFEYFLFDWNPWGMKIVSVFFNQKIANNKPSYKQCIEGFHFENSSSKCQKDFEENWEQQKEQNLKQSVQT